jgi:hypothetical protein
VVNIFDARVMTEPSIRQARRMEPVSHMDAHSFCDALVLRDDDIRTGPDGRPEMIAIASENPSGIFATWIVFCAFAVSERVIGYSGITIE